MSSIKTDNQEYNLSFKNTKVKLKDKTKGHRAGIMRLFFKLSAPEGEAFKAFADNVRGELSLEEFTKAIFLKGFQALQLDIESRVAQKLEGKSEDEIKAMISEYEEDPVEEEEELP